MEDTPKSAVGRTNITQRTHKKAGTSGGTTVGGGARDMTALNAEISNVLDEDHDAI